MQRTLISSRVEAYSTEEQVLFAAKSFLIDRVVPATEKIVLPSVKKPEGTINISIGSRPEIIAASPNGFKSKLKVKLKGVVLALQDDLVFDFRMHSPQNWSHALNLHLPFALHLIDLMKRNGRESAPVFIFPENTPNYIRVIFEKFGVRCEYFDGQVEAIHAHIDREDWHLIQIGRRQWLQDFFSKESDVKTLILDGEQGALALPRKVFLSRRKTRHILNEDEVYALLKQQGFERIYPEELAPLDQIRLFQQAEAIVAIHGAGLAPVIFKYGDSLRVIEIFSPGHMSEHFRAICSLNGVPWVGVRGVIEPKHVKEANKDIKRFLKFSLDGFRVEIESLKKALAYFG